MRKRRGEPSRLSAPPLSPPTRLEVKAEAELDLTRRGGAVRPPEVGRGQDAAVGAEVDLVEDVSDLRRECQREARRLVATSHRAAHHHAAPAAPHAAPRAAAAAATRAAARAPVYLLTQALSTPDLELRVIYNWQAPFTVFLHQRLWQFVADPLLGWPVENVYATTSIICGMIFVYMLLTFTAQLGRSPLESAVLAGLILTTGSMQLFFGYVENYTLVSLGLLITLFLAWRALHGEIQPVWPVLALSLTNAFHPSTVFLWPGMLLLSWLCWRRGWVSLPAR